MWETLGFGHAIFDAEHQLPRWNKWLCVYSAATDAGVKVHTVFGLLQAGWSTVAVEGGALGVRYQLSGTGAGMPDPCRVFVTQSDFYYTNPRLLWTKHNT